jgi:hypothetical protein
LTIATGFFLSSCGLEVVYFIDEPKSTFNNPLYSSDDHLTWYFSFRAAVTSSADNLHFMGTDVYYKIYNNYSNLTSHKSAILSVNTAANGYSAATRMIETYTYKPLGTSSSNEKAVFCEGYDNQKITIRLKNYQLGNGSKDASDCYNQNACVILGDSATLAENYIPYRNSELGTKSFDFFDYDEDNKGGTRDVEPKEGDSDYYYNSTFSEENCYYVQMFAVACGWDSTSVSPVYSLVLDLGSVPIRKGQ